MACATTNHSSVTVQNEKKVSLERMGVSVEWLKTGFLQDVKLAGFRFRASSVKVYDIEPGVLRGKGKDVVCPLDGRIGSSYVHALRALAQDTDDGGGRMVNARSFSNFLKPQPMTPPKSAVGPANYMLSYAWNYKVIDIINTLSEFCNSKDLDPSKTYIWICSLCVNQHRVKENEALGKDVPFEEFRKIFYGRVTGIGHILAMMSPWHTPFYLTRVWCIFEVYTASQQEGCEVTILMPPQEQRSLKKAILGRVESAKPGKGIECLYGLLNATKIQNAIASKGADRQAIMQLIENCDELNLKVNELLRAWVVQVLSTIAADFAAEEPSKATAYALSAIGGILGKMGGDKAAIMWIQKSVVVWNSLLPDTLGPNLSKHDIDTLLCIVGARNTIGQIWQSGGDLDAAITEYRMGLELCEILVDDQHFYIGMMRSYLATAMCEQGDYAGALSEQMKALPVIEAQRGVEHPWTARAHRDLGVILSRIGENEAALVEYRKALAILAVVRQANHPETATCHRYIGDLFRSCDRHDEALVEYRIALSIIERVLGKDDPQVGLLHRNIGLSLGGLGDLDGELVELKAALAFSECSPKRQRTLNIADIHGRIGENLLRRDDPDAALGEFMRASDILEEEYGADHPISIQAQARVRRAITEA